MKYSSIFNAWSTIVKEEGAFFGILLLLLNNIFRIFFSSILYQLRLFYACVRH